MVSTRENNLHLTGLNAFTRFSGGRVEPGSCPPGALADPDVPN